MPRTIKGLSRWWNLGYSPLTLKFRGIPGGYLSALEQRLTDTETALYDAISEIHRRNGDSQGLSQIVPLSSVRSSKASKTSRLAEWTMYPLKSLEDVDHWWMGLREQEHVDQGELKLHVRDINFMLTSCRRTSWPGLHSPNWSIASEL